MIIEKNNFVQETMNFFANTHHLCFDVLHNDFHGRETFERLIHQTFSIIIEEAREEFIGGVLLSLNWGQESNNTFERKDQFDLLFLELNFFNTRFDYINSNYSILSEIKSEDKIEVASVALKSVKDLMQKLPNWLQKVLTVLGEILGIAKTFI